MDAVREVGRITGYKGGPANQLSDGRSLGLEMVLEGMAGGSGAMLRMIGN